MVRRGTMREPGWRPVAASIALLGLVSCGASTGESGGILLHELRRGDLTITVRERGELQAASDTRVASELEGRATLIYLIPEGSVVRAGDKVAELDASAIVERRATQAISVARAEAAMLQARKNFEVAEQELRASENTARSRLRIAEIRLEKLLGQPPAPGGATTTAGTNQAMVDKLAELIESERQRDPEQGALYADLVPDLVALLGPAENRARTMGEIANGVLRQIDEISLTRADLKLAEDTLAHSRRLAEKGYITRNELERDQISHQRQLSRMAVAWNSLQLLTKYTLPENLITVEQEIENARLGLASVRALNEARRVREQAELKSSEAEFQLEKERLDNWNQQIERAVLRAPTPGLVVYGRMDWDEPVYEGMEVRERQEIVLLPDISRMVAELRVHEAQIDKVAVGQPATVRVDAFPDRLLSGRVTEVSTLPDPSPRHQEQKLYRVTVTLDGENRSRELRPGMSATVEIHVGTLAGVLAVPLAALKRHGTTHYVWVDGADGPVATEVTLGGNSLTHVQILGGLQEGLRVHLVPPAGVRLPAAQEPRPQQGEPYEASAPAGQAATAEAANGSR